MRRSPAVHLGQSVSVTAQPVKHVISAVGQAEAADVALLSTSLHDLKCFKCFLQDNPNLVEIVPEVPGH